MISTPLENCSVIHDWRDEGASNKNLFRHSGLSLNPELLHCENASEQILHVMKTCAGDSMLCRRVAHTHGPKLAYFFACDEALDLSRNLKYIIHDSACPARTEFSKTIMHGQNFFVQLIR